jgi:hypothetical protein
MNLGAVGVIVTLVLGILAALLASNAQQAGKVPRIGYLGIPRGDSPVLLLQADEVIRWAGESIALRQ